MSELLNVSTLMLCLSTGLAIICVFVTANWLRERSNAALFFWALAYFTSATGVFLLSLRGLAPEWLVAGIGNALTTYAMPLYWVGIRAFDDRPVNPLWATVPPAIWLGLYFGLPTFQNDLGARILGASVLMVVTSVLVAGAGWRGRAKEPLPARTWLSVFFGLHAAVYALRLIVTLVQPPESIASLTNGIFMFSLFALALMGGFSIFVMTRERLEFRYRREAEIDSLTGIFNRRAFIKAVDRLREQSKAQGALALLDLDHFKRINDTYGHAGGDEALMAFSRLLVAQVPQDAVFGRIGGEEFALYLPDCELEEARATCERLREAVERAPVILGAQELRMTVSIGLSADVASYADINFLLGIADRGLYISKRNGRNRVTALNASAGLKLIASLMAESKDAGRPDRDGLRQAT
ncbi:GGDEF domain-containing protein [Ciceribacter sp. L1K23]|uniref:GGDEF domain-containing protein n=1 Tax=Ciceribacter sp. L1K23 TaxID=2820276 RepID=UPI001B838533|nr:GGDEF domain-containing protein [Ciceribacter sp. L1K23]